MSSSDSGSVNQIVQFTNEERTAYRQPKLVRLIVDLSLPWIQAILGIAIFVIHPTLWSWMISLIFVSGAQHGLSLISHEAAHHLIWPQNKRINDFIATYLFAAPSLLPFNVYRQRHLIHHRLVSKVGDTKSFYLRDLRGWRFFAEILKSLSGLDYFLQALEAMRAGKGDEYEQFSQSLRRDQRSLLLVHAIIFLAFLAVDPLHYGIPTYYFILWLWPMVTLSFLLGKLRSVVEHQPSRHGLAITGNTPYFMNTPGPLLRSVHASWIERLVLSKINFHYHAEHHLWPAISYQYLPEVHARIWQGEGDTRLIKGNMVIFDSSYTAALYKIFRGK